MTPWHRPITAAATLLAALSTTPADAAWYCEADGTGSYGYTEQDAKDAAAILYSREHHCNLPRSYDCDEVDTACAGQWTCASGYYSHTADDRVTAFVEALVACYAAVHDGDIQCAEDSGCPSAGVICTCDADDPEPEPEPPCPGGAELCDGVCVTLSGGAECGADGVYCPGSDDLCGAESGGVTDFTCVGAGQGCACAACGPNQACVDGKCAHLCAGSPMGYDWPGPADSIDSEFLGDGLIDGEYGYWYRTMRRSAFGALLTFHHYEPQLTLAPACQGFGYVVDGSIGLRYAALGHEAGMGFPVDDAVQHASGRSQRFDYGLLANPSAQPAYRVQGGWLERWDALPGLRMPLGDAEMVGDFARQRFQGGTLYSVGGDGPTLVYGAMRDVYEALGGVQGWLGTPVADSGSAADGEGHITEFEHGFVYWDSTTDRTFVGRRVACGGGQQYVDHLLLSAWEQHADDLGCPLGPAFRADGEAVWSLDHGTGLHVYDGAGVAPMTFQRFEGGALFHSDAVGQIDWEAQFDWGAVIVPAPIDDRWIGADWRAGMAGLGHPSGPAEAVADGATRQCFEHACITHRVVVGAPDIVAAIYAGPVADSAYANAGRLALVEADAVPLPDAPTGTPLYGMRSQRFDGGVVEATATRGADVDLIGPDALGAWGGLVELFAAPDFAGPARTLLVKNDRPVVHAADDCAGVQAGLAWCAGFAERANASDSVRVSGLDDRHTVYLFAEDRQAGPWRSAPGAVDGSPITWGTLDADLNGAASLMVAHHGRASLRFRPGVMADAVAAAVAQAFVGTVYISSRITATVEPVPGGRRLRATVGGLGGGLSVVEVRPTIEGDALRLVVLNRSAPAGVPAASVGAAVLAGLEGLIAPALAPIAALEPADAARVHPRRINVRPEDLEVVLTDDPEGAMMLALGGLLMAPYAPYLDLARPSAAGQGTAPSLVEPVTVTGRTLDGRDGAAEQDATR